MCMLLLFTLMSIVVRLFHLCICTCAGMMVLEGWSEA